MDDMRSFAALQQLRIWAVSEVIRGNAYGNDAAGVIEAADRLVQFVLNGRPSATT